MPHDEQDEPLADAGGPSEGLSAQETKTLLARRILAHLKDQIENLERLLLSEGTPVDVESLMQRQQTDDGEVLSGSFDGRVVDGVFDGEHMIGEDGRKYLVPPNYASKSKLVEGDLLRLMISDNGRFLFKQKGPIERNRLVGMLTQDELTNDWQVQAGGQVYRVLTAAVTYHRGAAGDEGVILVPKNTPSRWAALENVIKREE